MFEEKSDILYVWEKEEEKDVSVKESVWVRFSNIILKPYNLTISDWQDSVIGHVCTGE